MDINSAKDIIGGIILELVEDIDDVTEGMELIGGNATLDSMTLVELCLALEDRAIDNGFEFDWTSESALSKTRSMFRTVSSLAEEYVNQCQAQK